MKEIPLNTVEKQSLSVLIDGVLFELAFKLCNGIMAATIIRDGVTIVENRRVVAGVGIIPQGDREAGNFLILTNNDDLPYFSRFAATDVLVYANEEETIAFREQLNQIVIRKDVKPVTPPKPEIKQPLITKQPANTSVNELDNITLSVVADNAISYQWRKDGEVLLDQTEPTLVINKAELTDAGNYTVIVTGEKYSSAVQSSPAMVVVTALAKPSFTAQPVPLVKPTTGPYSGDNLFFFGENQSLSITGAAVSRARWYQWQVLQEDGITWADLPDQISADLNLSNPAEGTYRLTAGNSNGTAISDEMTVINAYLFMQNDSANVAGSQFSLLKVDNSHYEMVNPVVSAGTNRPLGAFIRRVAEPNTNVSGVPVTAPTSVSSAPAVVSTTATTGRQTNIKLLATGTADVTISFGPLKSIVHFEVK